MKHIFTLLLVLITTMVIAQTQKVLTKSISVNTTHTAYVVLDGSVVQKEWDEEYIRVNTTVTMNTTKVSILKALVIVGRYNIVTKTDNNGEYLLIEMPKTSHQIIVGGTEMVDVLTFEIMVPNGYRLVVKNMASKPNL